MKPISPNSIRSIICPTNLLKVFIETLSNECYFLQEEFNFNQKINDTNSRHVEATHATPLVIINFIFNIYGFEIECNISQNGPNTRKFLLGEIIRFYHAEKDVGFLAPQASTEKKLQATLHLIAKFLKEHATPLLQGKNEVFLELFEFIKKPIPKRLP